jgi:hypothetical protein
MDEPLEIPDAAWAAARFPIDHWAGRALQRAAPLIVAAAYRTRARECNCLHDAELLNCAADELDQQGLTK